MSAAKQKSNKLWASIDFLLWLGLLIIVISAWASGRFIHNEIYLVETCNGDVQGNPRLPDGFLINNTHYGDLPDMVFEETTEEARETHP